MVIKQQIKHFHEYFKDAFECFLFFYTNSPIKTCLEASASSYNVHLKQQQHPQEKHGPHDPSLPTTRSMRLLEWEYSQMSH